MKLAVIETGGKQYLVAEGSKIRVEKLPTKAGDSFLFDKVLMVVDGDKVDLGKPYYGAKVKADLVEQTRNKKVIIRKYHSKNRFRRKKGHRQEVSVVKITGIE
jgi:large subunit ribosomal protein L21